VAQGIQLYMQYDPRPPFDAGTPETAPAALVASTRAAMATVLERREKAVRAVAAAFPA
jgi:cyclohexyl-isocyanide hydratase